jgi:hypothetical protein
MLLKIGPVVLRRIFGNWRSYRTGRASSPTIAVGLSTGCWAHLRALIKITSMEYETISHGGAVYEENFDHTNQNEELDPRRLAISFIYWDGCHSRDDVHHRLIIQHRKMPSI